MKPRISRQYRMWKCEQEIGPWRVTVYHWDLCKLWDNFQEHAKAYTNKCL